MDAPACIVCGTKHWSRMPCPAVKTVEVARAQARVAITKELLESLVPRASNDSLPTGVTNTRECVGSLDEVLPTSTEPSFSTVVKVERSGAAIRQAKWREANRERHRELERERMRRKRAK